jgi:tetratricopeptide (TPR) repeat protein
VSSFHGGSYEEAGVTEISMDHERKIPTTIDSKMAHHSPLSMLELYISGDNDPWSVYRHRDIDTTLCRYRKLFEACQHAETLLSTLPQELSSLDSSDDHSIPREYPLDAENKSLTDDLLDAENDTFRDDSAILTVTLAQYQTMHGEKSFLALDQEFKLARALERKGDHDEAEHRCCRILSSNPLFDVQAFLGNILANSLRLEESLKLFLSAVTGYITHFPQSPREYVFDIFAPIEELGVKLSGCSEYDEVEPIFTVFIQIMKSLQSVSLDGRFTEATERLLIHGLSMARGCVSLKLDDSARSMYQMLLDCATKHLDASVHGMEIAAAHQEYGSLLKDQAEWKLSAQHVLLACEAIMSLNTSDNSQANLLRLLRNDLVNVILNLLPDSTINESIAKDLRTALDRVDSKLFSCLLIMPTTYTAEFSLPLLPPRAKESTRSYSSAKSNKYGLITLSEDYMTGICDSEFYQEFD